ncbi:hypothetical protein D5085_00325 [Ectothiorhodospiraceae bacterium BW-2]|nr:hypothetical protein D5085_00325 [Ectothiorhodospiraceae bacterium BW-2]
MKIANPLYDVVFRYLMQDNQAAKLVISHIIGQQIEALEFGFADLSHRLPDGGLTVLRLEFLAKIVQLDGSQQQVIIELQKAKQYLSDQIFYTDQDRQLGNATPLVSIYILSHKLEHIDCPITHVKYDCYDPATKENIKQKEEFIESLIHNCYIIQVQRLKQSHQNKLEQLLSIFDQSYVTEESRHFLDLPEDRYDEELWPVIQCLQKASVAEEICEEMDLEDEFIAEQANLGVG